MGARTESYVDTSAFIALVDRSDTYHDVFRRLFGAPPRLFTTTLVIAELHGWFLRRFDRFRALQALGLVETMRPLRVLSVGPREQSEAIEVLRRFSDQDLTLADAVGLHLMEVRQAADCWSTDFRLGLTGVPLVIHAG